MSLLELALALGSRLRQNTLLVVSTTLSPEDVTALVNGRLDLVERRIARLEERVAGLV